MVSQREKFSSSVANAIDSYFCGLAEAQAFCICVSEERRGRLEVTAPIPFVVPGYPYRHYSNSITPLVSYSTEFG